MEQPGVEQSQTLSTHRLPYPYCWLVMPWIFLCSRKIWKSWFEFSSFVVDQSQTNGTRNHHSWEMTVSFSWTWIWRDETLHVLTFCSNPSRFPLCFVEHSRELSMRKKRTWWKKMIMVNKWAWWKSEHAEKVSMVERWAWWKGGECWKGERNENMGIMKSWVWWKSEHDEE